MRPSKCICLVALTVFLSQTTGCHSYRRISSPSPGIYDKVRVTTEAGEEVVLEQVEIDSLTIEGDRTVLGRAGRAVLRVEVSLQEVELIEVRDFSPGRTVGLCVIGLVVIGGGFLLLVVPSLYWS